MSSSDVRDIESLERLHRAMLRLSEEWQSALQEIRMSVARAEEYFTRRVPVYWATEMKLAEREHTEALDSLQRQQSAARASDRRSALEAQKRVKRAKDRVKLCLEKQKLAKTMMLQIRQTCEDVLGPLADMVDQSENALPQGARQLAELLRILHEYAEQQTMPPSSNHAATGGSIDKPLDGKALAAPSNEASPERDAAHSTDLQAPTDDADS